MPCPCGKLVGRPVAPYMGCCGRYIEDFEHTPAPDAESLMRSRYTAFVLERGDYLLATWASSHRPATLDFETGMKWLGLDIQDGRQIDDTHAEVEFVARSRLNGKGIRLHERSRFVRRDGRWFYVDGEMPGRL